MGTASTLSFTKLEVVKSEGHYTWLVCTSCKRCWQGHAVHHFLQGMAMEHTWFVRVL